jgi:hyaluronan synthase
MLKQQQETEISVEDDSAALKHCTQRISADGRILVSKKGWILRTTLLATVALLMAYNIEIALAVGDPLIVYSTLMPLHTLAIFAVGWVSFRSKARGKAPDDLVSVIIPAYNQKSLITQVVDAIFQSTYSNLEVIAVDDGSKDGTGEILDYLAQQYPSLKVIHKPNGGKRTAVARGFYASMGKFVVLIDSDSVVDKYALEELMKAFAANPDIGGVVANAKVLNARKNILTKCQDAWYDYAFNIHKTTESTFGAVLCCSGCLAAYRREAISRFIPYWVRATVQNSDDRDLTSYTMATPWAKSELTPTSQKLLESMASYDDAEDRALTAQTLTEWKTVYVPSAVVYTEVPDTPKIYLRQQTRWKKGYVRSSFYVSAFFWRKHPLMSLIFYTEFMMTFITPITIFAIFIYGPFFLQRPILPIIYLAGQLLVGVAAGLDYRLRDSEAKCWTYKPLMNTIASFVLPWLIFPALWNYRKNRWGTR